MISTEIIVKFLFFSVLAGWIATACFTGFLVFITKSGITNANMIVALGSLLTHGKQRAFQVGLIFHIFSGTFFGIFYTLFFVLIGKAGFGSIFLFGLLMGLLHGVIVALALVASIADYHPIKEYQTVNFGIALAHVIAHVIFGGVMGIIIGLLGIVQ